MPSHTADRPTGPATIWIVLRYVSALAAALPMGVAAALVFCQWNWGAGSQPDSRLPEPRTTRTPGRSRRTLARPS